MKFFKVKTIEEAVETVKANLPRVFFEYEILPLEGANNRVSAEDVFSPEEMPYFDRSTVDGYALKAEDVYGAGESLPSYLKIKGDVKIGEIPQFEIARGEAAAVVTGAAVPNGANAVAMIEHTEILGDSIAVYSPVKMRENILLRGDDIKIGEKVLSIGDRLSALRSGVCAGLGIGKIKVLKRAKAAIISTGDELVGIEESAQNGKIRDQNGMMISALCENAGLEVVSVSRIKDEISDLKSAVSKAAREADFVFVSGGSSVGQKDFTEQIFSELGEILIHGLAVKPGKPTIVAKIGGSLVFGLAGNPLAAALIFKVLFEDALLSALGKTRKPMCYAVSACNFPSTAGRTTIQPVTVSEIDSKLVAEPLFLKSANIAKIRYADGYAVLPVNCEGVSKGETIRIFKI